MEDEKDRNKRLDYRPDIKYEDDYYSDKAFREKYRPSQNEEDDNDDLYDEGFMDDLQDDIDHLVELIPMFPIDIQTAINQVFKPVFNDWYNNLKGRLYPTRIPDPDKPIIRPNNPSGSGGSTKPPSSGGSSTTKPSTPSKPPSEGDTPENPSNPPGGGDTPPSGGGTPGGSTPDGGGTPGGGYPPGSGRPPGGGYPPSGGNPPGGGNYPPGGGYPSGGGGGPGSGDGGYDPGNPKPGGNNGREFGDQPIIDPRPPTIYTPDPYEPIIPEPLPYTPPIYIGDDDDIFALSTPFTVIYEEIDPLEKIELEYTKNVADLYDYYLNKLKNVLHKFYLGLVGAIYGANQETGRTDCAQFIMEDIELADTEVEGGLRHLIDAGLRGEVGGSMKLSYCVNMFSLESTLYHMKDFKVSKELRTRYEAEEMMADGTRDGAISDRMLQGMRETYDKKYDTSYINLYKYLNSSVDILEDVLNTLLVGMRAKEILLKKGGTSE